VPESITFHGATVASLTKDFHAAVDHYLKDCEATGRPSPTPASSCCACRPRFMPMPR
jgi:predicted HicB family RNase H-like nuclease